MRELKGYLAIATLVIIGIMATSVFFTAVSVIFNIDLGV